MRGFWQLFIYLTRTQQIILWRWFKKLLYYNATRIQGYRKYIFDIQPHQSTFVGFKPHSGHFVGTVHLMFSSVICVQNKLKFSKSIPPFNLKILINLILGKALAVRARGMGSKSWWLLCYVIFEWPLGIILKWRYTIWTFWPHCHSPMLLSHKITDLLSPLFSWRY